MAFLGLQYKFSDSLKRSTYSPGCVADVSHPRVGIWETIFLVFCKIIPVLCTLETAIVVVSSAGGMRHRDKEVSVVPDFPFYFLPISFLLRPQRDLVESDCRQLHEVGTETSARSEGGLGDSCCVTGVCSGASCLLVILASAWSRCQSYFWWLTIGVTSHHPRADLMSL